MSSIVASAAAGLLLAGAVSGRAQAISGVAATSVGNTSAAITWTTDQPSSSLVNYGVTTGYGSSTAVNPALTTAHSVTLSGLAPNTLYDFEVVSATGASSSTSANFRFATLALAPILSNINVIYITSNSATVNWTTEQPSTSLVNYGTTAGYGSQTALDTTMATVHTVTINGLAAGTTYDFNVVSAGVANVNSTSANQTFTTPAAGAAPPNLSFVESYYYTNSSATLAWATDVPSSTVLAYGTTTALGQVYVAQTGLSTQHQVVLTGLTPGTTYYFLGESTGASGATGYAILSNFFTTGPASLVPIVANVAETNLTATSATITWTTNLPSTSKVNYGTTPGYGSSSPLDATLTTTHAVTLTGLAANTTYDFQLDSASTTGEALYGANMAGATMWAWGDSLTLGYGDLTQNTYPLYLTTLIGVPVANEGVGGTTSTQIAASLLATPAAFTPGNCSLIWSGANDPNTVGTILSDVASMVNVLQSPSCFLVMGDINPETAPLGTQEYSNIVATNQDEAAQYGANYLNIREALVQAYNPALAMDQWTHANDIPADSLHAVRAQGTITSGALDDESCAIAVSNGTYGVGTVLIVDAESILINAMEDTLNVTACTRGYNGTAATSHAAGATYSLVDPVHLNSAGYEIVAEQVAAWLSAKFPLNFTTPATSVQGPAISAVTVASITGTTAVVTWTTDQASTSLVNYGLSPSYSASSSLDSTLVTAHAVTLSGLTPNTSYDFDAVSANAAGATTTSANASFTTGAAPPPTISNVNATSVMATAATITWTTSQAATGQVIYGTTTNYGSQSAATSSLLTSQSVTLTGLTPNTMYDFEVVSANAAGASATSANYTFTTPASTATPPYVGYVAAWGINTSAATVTWSTDVPASTQLAYGTTASLGQLSPLQTALTASHGVTLSGLLSGTKYYFVAQSTGADGATGYSSTMTFTTTGTAPTLPPAISNVVVSTTSNTTATITWTTDQASSSLVNFGATAAYGSASALDPTLVTTHSVTVTGLTPGTTYDFDVVSANVAGQSSASGNSTFTTTTTTSSPPAISSVATTNVTQSSVTVTWTTDQASSSQVNYGTSTGYGSASTLDATLVTAHSVTLTGLAAGTTYDFAVVSANAASQSSTSPNAVVTTTALNAVPPYVGYVAAWGINNTGATVTWSTDVPATAQLAYGTSSALGQLSPLQTAMTASHGVILTGLNPGTEYYFVAQSTGAGGATGYSAAMTFTTTGTQTNPPPAISNVTVNSITDTTAVVTWTTDQATSSQVNYGLSTSYTSSSTPDTTLVTNHSVTLTGLSAGATYDFDVVSADAAGLSATSTNSTFSTTGTAPPPAISNVSSSGVTSGTATIAWTTDEASSSVVNYGVTSSYGSSASLPALVTAHSVVLTGLTPNTTYNFDVVSANAASISSTSANYLFQTAANTAPPPAVSYVAFWGITSSGVTIAWSTDVAANTAVAYGTTSMLGQLSPVQIALTNSHGVTLTGLNAGTTYYFVAQSADASGNTGYSTTYSFTTLPGPPTISGVKASPAAGNTAALSWTTSVPTTSYVQYGLTTSYGYYSQVTGLTAVPNCSLSFVPSGTVHYQLVSTDANGNQASSPDMTFVEP